MKEQSSRTFALFAILILFTTPLLANYHPAFATASTGVMIPLYSYPGSYWTQVIQAKNAHPSVPIVVIINPNNGPGSSIDSNYVTGIQQMQAAGITVLGYVYTSYGARSTSSIEADINSYNTWYHVNGINFDEMANTAGFETYYSNISNYAKSLGMTMTVGNPGTDTLSSYIGTVDILDIYENPGMPALSDLQGWHTSYPKSNFAFIGFGVSSLPSQSTINTDSGYVGYLYITDDTLPNPYDTVPSYLSTEVGMLDTGSTTTTAPGSPTGLTATASSSSQINLSWTAPSSNGGSAITGYKIEQSTNSGSTWSTIVSTTASTSTTYSNTGLTASTTYTYRVSAINAVGTSTPSSTASTTTSSGTVSTGTDPTGIVIPLYTYPGSDWTQVVQEKQAHPSVPIIAIINPNNGPGSSSDPTILSGVQQMQSAGVMVLGYVYTHYGSRTASSEEADINSYNTWYHVNGIFFDEMANTAGFESYYSTLNNYVHSHGMTYTMGNPGTSTISSYVGTMDNIMIYESSGLPSVSTIAGSTFGDPSSNFSFIAYGVSIPAQSFFTSMTPYVSYVYITDAGGSNPYNALPTYFNSEVADLDTGSGIVPTAPGSPTGLTATASSSSQINLSWTAPSSNGGSAITGYKIEQSTNSGTTWSTIVSNTASTSTTYSNTGLTASTAYTYRVSAINAVGTSTPSSTASATTGVATTAPGSPTGLTAASISSSQINLSWTAPSSNGGSAITGYKIEQSTNSGSTWSTIQSNTGSTGTTYSDTGLTANTTYTFRVSAINAVGTSTPSSTTSATTGATSTAPGSPTGLTATTASSSQINLSWTAPSSNGGSAITGYMIEHSTNSGSTWSTIQSNTGSISTTYSDTGLTANTTYTYRVSAINSVGTSSPSSTSSATTSNGTTTTVPGSPTGLTAASISSSQINLSWTAPSSNGGSAITGYKIEQSTNSGSTWSIIQSNTGSTGTTYSNTGLAASTTYTYRVSAINSVGTSTPSSTISAITSSGTTITSPIVLNGMQSTSATVSASPYQITLSNFNAGTGSNNLLVVGVSANNNNVASVTFGGVHLSKKVSSFTNNDAEFWYLKNPTGTGNIVVTMTGSTSAVVGAYSFSGVNETSPLPTSVAKHNTTPNSPNITITTKFANSMVLDLPAIYGGVTLGSPTCTQQWDANIPSAITGASSSTVAQSPGSVTCKWTASSGELWDDVAVEIQASTTTTTTSSPIILNGMQSTSATVSASPYQITLSNFNAGTGSNNLLVVGVSANNNNVASVTFGGTPLTQEVSSFTNNDAEFWYLKNPTGTGNIVVTMTGSTSAVVGAYSFSGVDQTTPIPASATNHNTAVNSPNITITTKFANSMVLDLPAIYGGVTLGSPTCTQQWDANIPSAITGASSSTVAQSPGSVTCKWTASSGELWDDVAVEIKSSG